MHDLLHDPLIGIRTRKGDARVSLPELLARLSGRDVESYAGLRAHQTDPWHVFLVQVAASVMARQSTISEPPADVAFWRAGLLDLADGCRSAWELLVDDVTRPAFMQHPLSGPTELAADFKPKAPKARTPDELDVLVTAKNHDLKSLRARADDPEGWLYALVCCQTTSGFLGAGNYGIARMNSGSGSRAIISMVSDSTPSARFVEEVVSVHAMRPKILGAGFGYASKGCVLTWLAPWDRKASQHFLSGLEPCFIEAVRPLRLVASAPGMVALGATSAARQVGPKALENGDLGDPWTAMNVADKKKGRSALTVSASGWTAERIASLLFEQSIELTELQKPRPGMAGDAWLVGSVLVRGQGKTEGFHRFALCVPAKVFTGLVRPEMKQQLGKIAEELIADAKAAERALKSALTALAEGGPQTLDFDKKAIAAWSSQVVGGLTRQWQEDFFPTIWRTTDTNPDIVFADWRSDLVSRARLALRGAESRMPLPVARRYRALVGAEQVLNASLGKKGLLPEREGKYGHPSQEVTA